MLLSTLLVLLLGAPEPGCLDRALSDIGHREFPRIFGYACIWPEEQRLRPLWDSLAEPLSVCGGAAALYAADSGDPEGALRRVGEACARNLQRNRDSVRAADRTARMRENRAGEEREEDWAEELAQARRDTLDRAIWAPVEAASRNVRKREAALDLQGFPGDIEPTDTRDSLDALIDSCRPGPGSDRETCLLVPDESMEYPFGDFAVDRYSIEFLREAGTPAAVTPVSVGIEDCADAARAKASAILDVLDRFSGPTASVVRGPRFGTRSCGDLVAPGPARWTLRSGIWEVVVDTRWREGEFLVSAAYRRLRAGS